MYPIIQRQVIILFMHVFFKEFEILDLYIPINLPYLQYANLKGVDDDDIDCVE